MIRIIPSRLWTSQIFPTFPSIPSTIYLIFKESGEHGRDNNLVPLITIDMNDLLKVGASVLSLLSWALLDRGDIESSRISVKQLFPSLSFSYEIGFTRLKNNAPNFLKLGKGPSCIQICSNLGPPLKAVSHTFKARENHCQSCFTLPEQMQWSYQVSLRSRQTLDAHGNTVSEVQAKTT